MDSIVSLDDLYFYQNKATGQASSSAISIRQLCRIVCSPTNHITPDTLLWSSPDWKQLREISILRECCAEWFYTKNQPALVKLNDPKLEDKENDSNDIETKDAQPSTETTNAEVIGPVSVKELRRDQNTVLMVYSPQFSSKGWVSLSESPFLLLALQAFDEPIKPYSLGSLPPLDPTNPEREDNVNTEWDSFRKSTGINIQSRDIEEEGYQSDGGTNYYRDSSSGNWIHEAVLESTGQKKLTSQSSCLDESIDGDTTLKSKDEIMINDLNAKKRKRNKAKFAARNAKCWVYISGLPSDTTYDEVQQVFAKAGIFDLDPETQKPKIKLYTTKKEKGEHEGSKDNLKERYCLKGDASICYARPESVDLCIQLFHEAMFRPTSLVPMTVERAKFEQRGESYKAHPPKSWQKRLVVKKAALQSIGWEENQENGRITGGRKGLTIVVLKNVFNLQHLPDSNEEYLNNLERKIRSMCSEWGTITKITIFASNPQGIVLIRFREATAATTTIEKLNGSMFDQNKIEAHFWDGVTDYTVRDTDTEIHDEEKRLEDFGSWLDSQDELPAELQLHVESS
jgi:RNA recognition motif-containing protein